jgi:hypothetical protein
MTQDAARRAAEIDAIADMLDSVGDVNINWERQLYAIATKVYEWKADAIAQAVRVQLLEDQKAAAAVIDQAVQGERERCARIADQVKGGSNCGEYDACPLEIAELIRTAPSPPESASKRWQEHAKRCPQCRETWPCAYFCEEGSRLYDEWINSPWGKP